MKRPFVSTCWMGPAILLLLLVACGPKALAQSFVHPGGQHNQADLDRMKAKVAAREHPWIDDWNKLIADPLAQDTFQPSPNPNMGVSRQRASRDAHAAYLKRSAGISPATHAMQTPRLASATHGPWR